jgi:release factor glutamine methyltransferase
LIEQQKSSQRMHTGINADDKFDGPHTIAGMLRTAPLPPLEARILIGHVTRLSRMQLITQSEQVLSVEEIAQIKALFEQRLRGEPIAYLTGEREFYGLALKVTPAVLIPRPETELLVELALQKCPPQGRLLDMGTGSGAIALAVAQQRPDLRVSALDVSAEALQIAQSNAQRHSLDVNFIHSDWFAALDQNTCQDAHQDARYHVIVSNPPYIVAGDAHLTQGDLRFEPVDALTDHGDGLSALRILSKHAASYLTPHGYLLMEHGYDQAPAVRELLMADGFEAVQSWRDLAGIERVSGGKRRG